MVAVTVKEHDAWVGLAMRSLARWLPIFILSVGVVAILVVDRKTTLTSHKYLLWLIDYHFGFARRGLVGEILRVAVGKHVPLATVELAARGVFAVIIAATLAALAQIRNRGAALLLAVLLAFSPLLLKNLYFDYGRFDSIVIAYVLGFLLSCGRFRLASWLLLLSPALLLMHEVALFIGLPVMAVAYYLAFGLSHPRQAARRLVAFGGLVVLTLAATYLLAAKPPLNDLLAHLSMRAGGPIDKLGTAPFWASAGLGTALDIVWSRVPGYDVSSFAIAFLPTLALIYRVSRHLFPGQPVQWLPVLGTLHTAPLFLIALDWARWASLCVWTSVLYLLALLLAESRQQQQQPHSQSLRQLNLTGLDALLVAWSFLLPAFGVAEPFTTIAGN